MPEHLEHLKKFVNPGTRLTYQLERTDEIETIFFQHLRFYPRLTITGWSNKKEIILSLRIQFSDAENRILSQCLLDLDEAKALHLFLTPTNEWSELGISTEKVEFETRHGFKYVCDVQATRLPRSQLFLGSNQPALIDSKKFDQFIFALRNFLEVAEALGLSDHIKTR